MDPKRATLKAILFADLQQYSRLTAADEAATLDFVNRSFEIFRSLCEQFNGQFIKTTGDGVLILFDSASRAVEYAMVVQERLRATTSQRSAGHFRVGIHLGEVHPSNGDVFGHSVNVAARIEGEAPPGGVCITEEVYRAARGSTAYGFRFAGRATLKNLPERVSLYHVFVPDTPVSRDLADRIAVSVIDGLSLSTERGDPLPLRSRKAQALVGYLALAARSQDTRDRVAALMWPDRSLTDARRALAKAVRSVDQAIGPTSSEALVRQSRSLALNPARTDVDVTRILDELSKGIVNDLILERPDWPDSILLGLEASSPLYAAWLSVVRHNLRARGSEALEALLERFDDGEPALRRAASALLLLEPSHERAAQSLIRHHFASGNFAAAMRVYENLRRILQERFLLTPSARTNALIQSLAAGPSTSTKPNAQHKRARLPRLAVEPFRAHREGLLHAVSGFRADLIANFSKFRELTIVETQGRAEGPSIEYSVTGESADAEDGVELFISLIEPAARTIIWSDSFVLSIESWSEAQKRIVGRIASALELYLSHDRLSRSLDAPPHDIDAYDAWLRGEQLLTQWSSRGDEEAAKLFEYAIARDPSFAPAYASLASVHNSRHLIRPGAATDPELERYALELAERAVALDPLDARNHLVVAWATAMVSRFEQSELHYDLAAELNPNSPRTLISAALGLAFMGRGDRAAKLYGHAMTLTPLFLDYQWSHIATVRFFCGDLHGTIQAADRSKNIIVDTPGWKAAALMKLGREEEARGALAQLQACVSKRWEGTGPATIARVVEWFVSAFPIKQAEDRTSLSSLRQLV
jgi:class 3 adenylate cyclase/DNA-binding SARP family transcriptional activator